MVGTRETDGRGACATATSNLELCALHLHKIASERNPLEMGGLRTYVELSTRVGRCCVEGNDLMTEEVLTRLDARRDREGNLTRVGDQGIDCPCLRRCVKTVLVDLEPIKARDIALSCVRDLRTSWSCL